MLLLVSPADRGEEVIMHSPCCSPDHRCVLVDRTMNCTWWQKWPTCRSRTACVVHWLPLCCWSPLWCCWQDHELHMLMEVTHLQEITRNLCCCSPDHSCVLVDRTMSCTCWRRWHTYRRSCTAFVSRPVNHKAFQPPANRSLPTSRGWTLPHSICTSDRWAALCCMCIQCSFRWDEKLLSHIKKCAESENVLAEFCSSSSSIWNFSIDWVA